MLRSFPGRTRPVSAFLHLIEGIGRYQLTVEVHDLRDDSVIARSPTMEISFPEKLSRINFVVRIPSLPLTHGGIYDVVVLADGQEIDRQQFGAISRENEGADQEDPPE